MTQMGVLGGFGTVVVLGECFGARKAEMLEIHAVTCWAS